MKIFSQIRYDLPSSIIVFFVALPLCLGIALASGAPLFSGLIAGIVGGIVVGSLSGSALGVSGPAAGLVTIVLSYIATLGSFEAFLMVVVIAGIIQLIMGYLKLGSIAYYFPSSVIKGMLTGIGITIIVKQIPYAAGYDFNFAKSFASEQLSEKLQFFQNNFPELISYGAVIITSTSVALMVFWEVFLGKKYPIFKALPAPLIVVVIGIIFSVIFQKEWSSIILKEHHLVTIPSFENFGAIFNLFTFPDLSQITNIQIYGMAVVLAVVASLETLLSVEACDKIDPIKRLTPTNRELKAQGIGNIICGFIGGLPVTQVIVRSSANVTFGARSKASTILHGIILLLAIISIPKILNMIPLASLASILLVIGYKLAKPSNFKQIYKLGHEQFLPFIVTVVGMMAFDLLKGVMLGMVVATAYIIINNFHNAYRRIKSKEGRHHYIYKLSEEVSFLNRGKILQMLMKIPSGAKVTIDGRKSKFIHYDVLEILRDFKSAASSKNIVLEIKGINL